MTGTTTAMRARRLPAGLRSIERYFFEPMAPTTLAIARLMIFGLLFWKSLSRAWWRLADLPPSLLWRPWVPTLPYVTHEALVALTIALILFSLLGFLGVLTRLAAAACFVVLYLFNAIDGGLYDSGWLSFSCLLLLASSRCADRFTIRRGSGAHEPSFEYRWPLRLMQLAMILVYFENGSSKLQVSGLGWTEPHVLAGWYEFHGKIDSHYWTYGELLVRYPLLSSLGAWGTLLFENGVVLVPFLPALRWFFVPGLIFMHVVIGLTLNIWFTEYFLLLLLFFDWHPAVERLREAYGRWKQSTAG
jgi:hypothetical protein